MSSVCGCGSGGGGGGGGGVCVCVVWYVCRGWVGVSVGREQLRKEKIGRGMNRKNKGDNVPIALFEPTILCL